MKSEFPEKAFETYINYYLLNKGFKLYIPSQAKEAKEAYDALINNLANLATTRRRIVSIALQYKVVSEYKVHKIARNFKFDLYASKKKKYTQHNILYKKNKSSKYYAAGYVVPSFVTYQSLCDNLKYKTLLNNSYFIMPQYKISDSGYHYYTFDKNHALQHSPETLDSEILSMAELLKQVDINGEAYAKPIENFIESLLEDIEDIEERSQNGYPVIAYKLF